MSRAVTERLVALIFLAGCVAYGRAAQEIELLFGAQFSPFSARTFPSALAWAGGIVSALIFLMPGPAGRASAFAGLAWAPALALAAMVAAYALVIPAVGFFAASALFIAGGAALLGERRPRVLAPVALGVSLGLFLILNTLLGIYIDDPLLRLLGLA